ncbi:hypothetical protein DMA12_13615 [Amycolatopsis balhimycina DSM 5908]|uniref:Uncharacterized protein n=1 Tax=Amycolatopsis balhimycina DSM 5908 TaxID=1081091 RepID=A0A428WQY1_AMYBA|nr:hypothetical protein [Amycolatopsis balhimycina]RSM45496.1 hypothetical protein DMA12_13615 [Amycolatopsis balhimycina DSM 5908]
MVADEEGPLCDQAEFDELVNGMVATFAPRLFAIVQEYGDRFDARIAAWGMAFDDEDEVEVISVGGALRMSYRTPDRALRSFARHP